MEWEPTSTVTVISVCADDSSKTSDKRDARVARRLTIGLAPFAWEALEEEAAKQGVSIAELASFAVLYYLADGDSGRIARRLPAPHRLEEPHPLGKLLGD
ncbi:MAG: hypothetical protein ACRDLF_05350 [Solirubrobacteraceae bacterium]